MLRMKCILCSIFLWKLTPSLEKNQTSNKTFRECSNRVNLIITVLSVCPNIETIMRLLPMFSSMSGHTTCALFSTSSTNFTLTADASQPQPKSCCIYFHVQSRLMQSLVKNFNFIAKLTLFIITQQTSLTYSRVKRSTLRLVFKHFCNCELIYRY